MCIVYNIIYMYTYIHIYDIVCVYIYDHSFFSPE